MLITTGGVLIRTRVKEIRELGRATQGVTLINLGEGEKLSGIEKIVETDDDEIAEDGALQGSELEGAGSETTELDATGDDAVDGTE
jgi:DNA gyrase subunit A